MIGWVWANTDEQTGTVCTSYWHSWHALWHILCHPLHNRFETHLNYKLIGFCPSLPYRCSFISQAMRININNVFNANFKTTGLEMLPLVVSITWFCSVTSPLVKDHYWHALQSFSVYLHWIVWKGYFGDSVYGAHHWSRSAACLQPTKCLQACVLQVLCDRNWLVWYWVRYVHY